MFEKDLSAIPFDCHCGTRQKYPKQSQYKYAKSPYRIRNWPEYEADLLEVELPIPDHTTLSRRLKKLGDINSRGLATDRPIHLLIDSTGLRIHVGHLRKLGRPDSYRVT